MTVVVVAGALANKPGQSGEAWVKLSWIRGLQRLGIEADRFGSSTGTLTGFEAVG